MGPVTAVVAGVEEFAETVAALDPAAGRAVVRRLLAEGADPVGLIDQVIVPSQRQVGLRWQRAEWSVAQQHAATEVALAAAEVIREHLRPVSRQRGHVLLACAEREWHGLPVTLVGLAIESAGWETTVLGAGVSPLRLSRHLHELGPDATLISCSVLASLPTSRRFVEASAAAGVPTVVGGAAFGADAAGPMRWVPPPGRPRPGARCTRCGGCRWWCRRCGRCLASRPVSWPHCASSISACWPSWWRAGNRSAPGRARPGSRTARPRWRTTAPTSRCTRRPPRCSPATRACSATPGPGWPRCWPRGASAASAQAAEWAACSPRCCGSTRGPERCSPNTVTVRGVAAQPGLLAPGSVAELSRADLRLTQRNRPHGVAGRAADALVADRATGRRSQRS